MWLLHSSRLATMEDFVIIQSIFVNYDWFQNGTGTGNDCGYKYREDNEHS